MSAAEEPLGLLESVELPGGGTAVFTSSRQGNMSSVGGDGHEQGAANRERLRLALGLDGLARGFQVHGSTVARALEPVPAGTPPERLQRADGQATSVPGLGAMVLSADCLPVALGARGAVAMIHAGWRGIAAGVLEQGLAAVRELAPGARVTAVIGPCAGGCCYEVGPEVHAALAVPAPGGRERIDLRAIARERLLAGGAEAVGDVGGCTICDERLFSHRREGDAAGRMAAVAWLS